MAFRTNLVPAIEERTVSGSSVSFNSAFALPLKACKVSFSATQAGSGEPSPSNPRAISGVSAIGLTANSTPVSVSLGEERFGGELDVLTGVLTVTHIKALLNARTWTMQSGTPTRYLTQPLVQAKSGKSRVPLCEIFKGNNANWVNDTIVNGSGGDYSGWISIFTDRYESLDDFYTAIDGYYYVYEIDNPITIQLSANELSSIIGNNTFSTDTGTLEITFADLQEKSASGAVATFNTALAMPLASCNIAVNAWQEGSGDPSPDNVRPIHGFSEVNATRCGKNLVKVGGRTYAEPTNIGFSNTNPRTFIANSYCICLMYNNYYNRSWFNNLADISVGNSFVSATTTIEGSQAYSTICLPIEDLKTGVIYSVSATLNNCEIFASFYKANGTYNGYSSMQTFTIPNETKYTVLIFRALQIGAFSASNIQLEAGSTATAYEPYVTPTIYTIQLGQEVYGAEVDVVNGVAHVTHLTYILPTISSFSSWYDRQIVIVKPSNIIQTLQNVLNVYGDVLKATSLATDDFACFHRYDYVNIIVPDDYTVADFNNNIAGTKIIYPLKTPFDIQLTPQQIETIAGKTNTIFADTGDIDLTYKDLDIAKRGNFREVFKLPS